MGSGLNAAYRIVVLGGYGHFGGRILRALAPLDDIELIVAGRSLAKASRAVAALKEGARARLRPAVLDHGAERFGAELAQLEPHLVIHTSGPFQGQDYLVARACIDAGAHYVDLADGRDFVAGIASLDAQARARDVLVVAGASTLPALSSAVIDALVREHGAPRAVRMSIAPGQRTPRGIATLKAVMSYCGKRFTALDRGEWRAVYGWQGIHRHRYPEIGARWLSWCDVPDLAVLPRRYPTLTSVRFDAGLEIGLLQWGFWAMAALTRLGVVRDWSRYAQALKPIGDAFNRIGSDRGGMHVELEVEASPAAVRTVTWNLVAASGHGPEIPCIPAIVLAKKLAAGALATRGAQPCMGMMTLDEFAAAVSHLDIRWGID